jgi:hypothetical protein
VKIVDRPLGKLILALVFNKDETQRIMFTRIILSAICLIMTLWSCNNILTRKDLNMEFRPKEFAKVPINTEEKNHCSPIDPGFNWYGIIIVGPEEVFIHTVEGDIFIPICGFYQIKSDKLIKADPIKINIRLEGEDKIFYGFLIKSREHTVLPHSYSYEIKPEDVKDQISLGYFNPDLLKYVDFPLITGIYEVFVEYGGMRSNTVTIKIQIK